MRVSMDPKDRGFDEQLALRVKLVTLDARPVHAITADDEEGYVKYIVTNPDGSVVRSPCGENVLTTEGRGKVVIELTERKWDPSRKAEGARVDVGREVNGNLVVRVHSVARRGAIRRMTAPAWQLPNDERGLIQLSGRLAGAAAEHMAEKYGDRTDPSEAAKAAIDACSRMLEAEGQGLGDVATVH